MSSRCLLCATASLILAFGVASADAAEPLRWDPAKTWVFMVGMVEWQDPKIPRFQQADRQDDVLAETFRARGVPAGRITHLKDAQATTANARDEFLAFLKKPKAGDWVFVYYTGHGSHSADHKTFFATYDAGDDVPGWLADSIPLMIEKNCRASFAIVAADNCCSGAIAEAVRKLDHPKTSFAAFASAHVNSISTGNWTFTENLVYAFRGDGYMDDDGDGTVTLRELRDNAAADMTFAETQMPQFAFSGALNPEVVVSKAARPTDPEIGQRAEFLSYGDWYKGFVVDRDGEKRKVHYYGWAASADEWVTPDMVRQVPERKTLPVGTTVEALSWGEWYTGHVVGVRAGMHLIKFDGWTAEWNEWLPIDRLRKPAGKSPRARPAANP